MKRSFEWFLVVAVCALVGWFDVWTVQSTGEEWDFGTEQRDYYNLLIDGYLAGQLNMKVEVPEALLKLEDPYDPKIRPLGLGMHDASFYKGKYYVYFGAAPMVVVMLPFRLLTGIDLPLAFAELIFVYGAFLASVAGLLAVRRSYFPHTGTLTVLLCILVLGFAGLGPMLLRRPHMWELPIAGGYCFAMAMLACIFASLHSARRRLAWFAAAGLALGLAIGSRPTYLLAGPCLLIPLLWWWRAERLVPWRPFLGALVPLAIIGAAMAWHNYARFDNPLQFGQAYQFSLDYESKMAHFSASYFPFNAWRYFWSAAQWSSYFPFIQPADLPPKPAGFAAHDDLYGILRNLPIAWGALAAPLALWRRDSKERGAFGAWLASAALVFVVMAGVLVMFFGSLARYQSDFTPVLMLLTCVGILTIERGLRILDVRAVRWGARVLWMGAAMIAVVFGALFSIQLDNLMIERNPRVARDVAELLNHIPAAIEQVLGVRYGGAEVTVRLRPQSAGEHVVLTVGEAPRISRVKIHYFEENRIAVGFAQGEAPEILSRPFRIDFNQPHTVRVALGSLFPPASHPHFKGRSTAEVTALTRLVRIDFDGETLIDERHRFDGANATLRAGRKAVPGTDAPFDGEISGLRRIASGRDAFEADTAAWTGFVRLRLTFPERPSAPREPLLGIGDARTGGILFAHFLDDSGQIAFGTSARGDRGEAGDSVSVDLRQAHELTARWAPVADPGRRRVEIRLDGTIVLSRELPWPERDGTFATGRNISGEPGCADQFTGRIHHLQRSPNGADPLLGRGDTLKLRLQLPRDQMGQRDPLVVTGQNGGGDLLMIEYLEAGAVRFVLDHWGSPSMQSEPVKLDFAQPHEFEIALGSLAAPADVGLEEHVRRGRVNVMVDGKRVWETGAELFTAEATECAIGRNPIGGTGCGPVFTGAILGAERISRE